VIVTELRDLGDNRTVVIYTNDNRVYRNLCESVKPIKIVPYEQEQGGKLTMLGVDLYFPKEYRKWLGKNIGIHTPKEKVHKTGLR
jgi:hypothetical protein